MGICHIHTMVFCESVGKVFLKLYDFGMGSVPDPSSSLPPDSFIRDYIHFSVLVGKSCVKC